MGDVPIPWSTAGARLSAAPVDDGLSIVLDDPDGAGERSFDLPAAALARAGPALVSPKPCESLAAWLRARLGDESSLASRWHVVAADRSSFDVAIAEGTCRIDCRGQTGGSAVSRFRHDARSLLNSIGMNADLAGMLAEQGGIDRATEAAARIRTSSDALAALISTWTKELESGHRLPVAPVLETALRRGGVGRLEIESNDDVQAPRLWCLASARLLTEWAAWVARAERTLDASPSGGDRGLVLTCDKDVVRLRREGTRLPAGAAFAMAAETGSAAVPGPAEPATVLGELCVGFGSWEARRGAGVCVGVPKH